MFCNVKVVAKKRKLDYPKNLWKYTQNTSKNSLVLSNGVLSCHLTCKIPVDF